MMARTSAENIRPGTRRREPSYKDKFFPVVRHKDIYMGISWASGVVPGERQEESSSEV